MFDGVKDYSHEIAEMIGLKNESNFIQPGLLEAAGCLTNIAARKLDETKALLPPLPLLIAHLEGLWLRRFVVLLWLNPKYDSFGYSEGVEQQAENNWKGVFSISSYTQYFNVDTYVVINRLLSSFNPAADDF